MTKVYGCSDDLLEFDGDVSGEVGCYDADIKVTMSDGTKLLARYGKKIDGKETAIWQIDVVKAGDLFDRRDVCTDEDADPYSDVIYFKDGLTKATANGERVR